MKVVRNAFRSTWLVSARSGAPTSPSRRSQRSGILTVASRVTAGTSCAVGRLLAEAARGLEDEDEDQDAEDHRLRPARIDEEVREGRDDPDHEPADEGAADVADAAHHGRGEGVEPV